MRIRGRWMLVGALVAGAFAGLWMGRWKLLETAGTALVVADAPQRADLIYLLNGDLDTRPAEAAALWQRGLAPGIAIARSESSRAVEMGLVPNVTDLAIQMLGKLGVPPDSIIEIPFPGGVTSTRDEAEALRRWLVQHPAAKVLIVTNAIHTRRVRGIFGKVLRGSGVQVLLVAVPDRRYDVRRWWENEHGFLGVYNEYLKLFYYWLRY